MNDHERYVSQETLLQELAWDAEAFQGVDDFDALLERLLDEESDRIEGFAERSWGQDDSPDDDDAPVEVRDGVIRLVRSRLQRIQTDGIGNDQIVGAGSASYRPPEEILDSVREQVAPFRPRNDTDRSAWAV